MFKGLFFITILFLGSLSSNAQGIISPDEFLGYELGTYFSRHHQVVDYFYDMEEQSNGMLNVLEYGRTNENRKLILAFISSEKNIQNLEKIRQNHAAGKDESVSIVWLSYNVHGNESSGTEASMRTAYELLSNYSDWLENVLVIIDPCLNPDGRDRYVNWYNQEKNSAYNANSITSEHNEPWPYGRLNHYLFDLNRDWVWLTQVESQQRIAVYNQWLPHVHADFHEQGIDNPYYFPPAAEPFHDVITDWQRESQTLLGKNHAKYFDSQGWLYFTREEFDLLYPGYGDTYPTYLGAIGATYEQAGSSEAGLGVINEEGDTLTLKDRIAHHHITGISTVQFAMDNSSKLISEFQDYSINKNYKYKSFVLWGDRDKLSVLTQLLSKHSIQYTFGNGEKATGFDYLKDEEIKMELNQEHIIISTSQKRGTLINVLFEPKTNLSDSITYDLTAWSLPYAYGINCLASEKMIDGVQGNLRKITYESTPKDAYAYLIPWNSMSDAKALTALLNLGVQVRYAEKEFSFGEKTFNPGTLIIIKPRNEKKVPNLDQKIREICLKFDIDFATTNTGMVDEGKDFGSASVKLITPPKVGLLTKQGSPSAIGQVWHFFENELDYPINLINSRYLDLDVLQELDVLIVPTGSIRMDDDDLLDWIYSGGKLIVMGSAMNRFGESEKFELESKNADFMERVDSLTEEYAFAHTKYVNEDRNYTNYIIPGTIYKCKVENTNPMAFGYQEEYFTLKESSRAYKRLKGGQNVAYIENNSEPVSGFVGKDVRPFQANSLVFGVENQGWGSIIYMVDNPLYRGFWENGKLFFVNSIFFVNN